MSYETVNRSEPEPLVRGKVGSVDKVSPGGSQWIVSGLSFPGGTTVIDCVSGGVCTGSDKDPVGGKPRLVDLK